MTYTILDKMNIFNFGHRVRVCIGVSGEGGGGLGGGRMESSWEVLVLPVIFITPGKRAILFPFVYSILRIHCQNMLVVFRKNYI